MIEISFGKLLVLALIALIVLGPEKLPAAARTAGALLRRVRSGWDSVRSEVERELQVEEIRRTARETVAHMDAAQADLDKTLQQVRDVAGSAAVVGSSSQPEAVAADAGASAQEATLLGTDAVPAAAEADTVTVEDVATGDLFAPTEALALTADTTRAAASESPHGAN